MSIDVVRAEIQVYRWLGDEHGYQFGNFDPQQNPQHTLKDIMETGLRDRWEQLQIARQAVRENPSRETYLPANRHLLKATAAMRLATILHGTIHGVGYGEEGEIVPLLRKARAASSATFRMLREHFNEVNAGKNPLPSPALLDEPLAEAIAPENLTPINGQYRPGKIFIRLADLAIDQLVEQQQAMNAMTLPMAGEENGAIGSWRSAPQPN